MCGTEEVCYRWGQRLKRISTRLSFPLWFKSKLKSIKSLVVNTQNIFKYSNLEAIFFAAYSTQLSPPTQVGVLKYVDSAAKNAIF